MISTQQIHYILALAEHQNFSRAAEACFVTQPTLSMQIKKAEGMIGFPIFDRDRTPLELTAAGKELIPLLREIASDYEKIDRLKKQIEGNFSEEIKIGIIPTVSAYMIPGLYTAWQYILPNVHLIIEEKKSEEILEDIYNKKTDVGIMAGPVTSVNLRIVPLFTEEIKAFHPNGKHQEIAVEALQKLHPWLLNKGNCLRTQMVNFCGLREDENTTYWNYEGGNMEMLIRMVNINGGYTLVPENFGQILAENSENFKSIFSEDHKYPARSIIGILQPKSVKQEAIEAFFKSIQSKYNLRSQKKYEVLNWK